VTVAVARRTREGLPGWLETLLGAVRVEFRADPFVARQEDPVLFGHPCLVDDCPRSADYVGECRQASTTYICATHYKRWNDAGRPELLSWAARQDVSSDIFNREPPVPKFYVGVLPSSLKLEVQYGLQCRHDERRGRFQTKDFHRAVGWLRTHGIESVLNLDIDAVAGWGREAKANRNPAAFLRFAHGHLTRLRFAVGDSDVWQADIWPGELLPRSGTAHHPTRITFTGIGSPWFRELVKRWARTRILSTGISPYTVQRNVCDATAFAQFCEVHGVDLEGPQAITRALLERYLAEINRRGYKQESKKDKVVTLRTLLNDARIRGWDDIAPSATFHRGEAGRRVESLPRAIDEHVMRQIEDPANLDRIEEQTVRTTVVILIDGGLRSIDALRLPFDPLMTGVDGAPYLRYMNHKLRREAVIPVSDRMVREIRRQQEYVRARWPNRSTYLLPAEKCNPDGLRHLTGQVLRKKINRWMRSCDMRDASGRPSQISAHQFRHTLGTRMVNDGVPLEIVRRMLDHESMLMTQRYARISDETLREAVRHFHRRVNIDGELIEQDSDGLLGEASWMKENIARARQALPNGSCALPLQQICPYPNACLSCSNFLTDESHRRTHVEHLAHVDEMIRKAKAKGWQRIVEVNERDRLGLINILEGLDRIRDEQEPAA
jgi:site-specific recombinase XerD